MEILSEQRTQRQTQILPQFQLEWCSASSEENVESLLQEILRLRKICFPAIREVLSEADLTGKHLVIRNSEGMVCGAYRVTLSTQIKRFESEDDFVLNRFLKKEGIKAELAWACVHPDYRDGRAIHLLWRGLAEFFKTHHVRYVFGLASICTEGSDKVLDIINFLKSHNYVMASDSIQARNGYFSQKALVMERPQNSIKRRLLPSLLRAYLMAGALVCLQPVFDPDLDCYDFMTVLDVENVSASIVTHFDFK